MLTSAQRQAVLIKKAEEAVLEEQKHYNYANRLRVNATKYDPYPSDLYFYAIVQRDNEALYLGYKRMAAVAGERQAQYDMASYSEHGYHGLKKDLAEAIRFYTMAIMNGCHHSRSALARIKCDKKSGKYYDLRDGIEHYNTLAADYNCPIAMYDLALVLSKRGIGRFRDTKAAIYWLQKACNQGYYNAIIRLEKLGIKPEGIRFSKAKTDKSEDLELTEQGNDF